MRKILIIVWSAFMLILLINYFYYRNLYRKQVNYITELLDRQVQIVGLDVDSTNNSFVSDLNQINYNNEPSRFFDKSKPEIKYRVSDQLKLFYSKYRDFVVKLRLYDNNMNEYTLSKDEQKNEWIEGEFISLDQRPVEPMEKLIQEGNEFNYYTIILDKNNQVTGNIVATVDFNKYFTRLFSKFNLKDYQWQWVLLENGTIIYDNNEKQPEYSKIDKIAAYLQEGVVSNIVHSASFGEKTVEIFSSFYSTQLLRQDLGLVFSSSSDFFQKYIIRNSIFIVTATLILIALIILVLWQALKQQQAKNMQMEGSEKMLMKLIEEMPVGIIIINKKKEILKANKVAAGYYSYSDEGEMTGKLFTETTLTSDSDYFSRHLGEKFGPEQFLIIKKPVGELILFRSAIPVTWMMEEATLEILIDVTMLESARKQEAKANIAKTEFLARMSYEIRTPLNGIIGMSDILNKYELSPEVRDIVYLLRRSTEVLLGIVNDILDFSKIESGKMILEESPFNLKEEIYFAVDLSKTTASEKNNTILCEIADNVPDMVIGDPYRLRQVLVNLLNHSVSNTTAGEVHLKCRKRSEKSGMIVLGFEIADTGKSFDKAELKKIFGDIIYAESIITRNSNESGFSTIIARQLIEMMGGTLTAVSPSGIAGSNGTRISFSIQVYSNERIAKNVDTSDITDLRQVKTLVITGPSGRDEDLLGIFHKTGLRISVTSFTKATINQIKINREQPEEKYDLLIITDDEHFDGLEVARQIFENQLSPEYRIMMVSSADRKGNYLKCITMGVDYYIVKPFDISEFQNAVVNVLGIETETTVFAEEKPARDLAILIVEDNKMNQNILSRMLGTLGYKCDVAEEGYEGYLKAKNKKYDIIFMDLIMSEMDGYESARRILEVDKMCLIAAFTADNMPESRKKAEICGIKEFISKPVRIEELKKLFNKYFGV